MCFKMPKINMPKVTMTGRDILPSSEAESPESPVFGGSDDPVTRGKSTLKIPITPNNASLSQSRGYSGYNR